MNEKTENAQKGALKRRFKKKEGKPITASRTIARAYKERIKTYFGATIKAYEEGLRQQLISLGYSESVQLPRKQQERLLDYVKKTGEVFTENTKVFANKVATSFTSKIDENVLKSTASSLKKALSVEPTIFLKSEKVQAKLITAISENVNLIEGLGDDIRKNIESIINISTVSGSGVQQIMQELQSVHHLSNNRAKLIANDQTKKITTQIASQRMQDAGIQEWKWLHSGGGIPRKLHLELSGKVFRFDEDPPFIDEKGKIRGYPSQLINCKCKMVPVVNPEVFNL